MVMVLEAKEWNNEWVKISEEIARNQQSAFVELHCGLQFYPSRDYLN